MTETWLPSVNGVVTRLGASVAELRSRGHEVMVVAPTARGDVEVAEPEGVEVRRVPSIGVPFIYGGEPWGLPLPRVVRLLEGFRPHVVHAVSPFLLGWAAVIAARARGYPLVCSYHTQIASYTHFYGMGFVERPVWAMVRAAHQQADLNLAASDAARRDLESHGVPGVEVWHGAVDLGRFHPGNADAAMRHRLSGGHPGRPVCLYVGRLAAEKGIDRLLPLADPDGGRHLALVGDGPAREALEQAGAGANVTFLGALAGAELASAYASADVFVFPSTTDTLGLVVLEAMASGLPVVAADAPPARDVLDASPMGDGPRVPPDRLDASPAGALFDAADTASLLRAVGRWLEAAPDRERIASAARGRVCSWQRSTDELLAGYHRARATRLKGVAA